MQSKLLSFAVALALAVGVFALSANQGQAAEGGIPGKPSRDYTSVDQLPNGIRNKVDENGNYREGQRGFNPNSRWGQAIRQIQEFNQQPEVTEVDSVASNEQVQVVCPTSLDDEAMRLCLGLPAVKKTVRVKKLNVQLGDAQ